MGMGERRWADVCNLDIDDEMTRSCSLDVTLAILVNPLPTAEQRWSLGIPTWQVRLKPCAVQTINEARTAGPRGRGRKEVKTSASAEGSRRSSGLTFINPEFQQAWIMTAGGGGGGGRLYGLDAVEKRQGLRSYRCG